MSRIWGTKMGSLSTAILFLVLGKCTVKTKHEAIHRYSAVNYLTKLPFLWNADVLDSLKEPSLKCLFKTGKQAPYVNRAILGYFCHLLRISYITY